MSDGSEHTCLSLKVHRDYDRDNFGVDARRDDCIEGDSGGCGGRVGGQASLCVIQCRLATSVMIFSADQ